MEEKEEQLALDKDVVEKPSEVEEKVEVALEVVVAEEAKARRAVVEVDPSE